MQGLVGGVVLDTLRNTKAVLKFELLACVLIVEGNAIAVGHIGLVSLAVLSER